MTDSRRNALLQTLEEVINKLVAEGMRHDAACRAIMDEVATLQDAYSTIQTLHGMRPLKNLQMTGQSAINRGQPIDLAKRSRRFLKAAVSLQ
ncbi:hypothetical protein [Agrobacterium rosae]|uniref:hypothetical protein n=1 Tax=Agrobacterium rosae TaxID=1972867 RepID=UPI003B9FDC82